MKRVPLLMNLLLLCVRAFAQPERTANGGAEPVGFWRFEKDVKSEVPNAGVVAAKRRAGAAATCTTSRTRMPPARGR